MTHGMASRLYVGEVMHHRLRPRPHRFVYRVFYLLLDLGELDELSRRLRLLRIDRPGLLSLRREDHGARDGSPLEPWARARLAEAGVELDGGPIRLLCMPRLWGYVFNPLSVYFGHGPDGDLRGIVYEVKNTLGGQRTYAMPVRAQASGRIDAHGCDKDFYVSPFIPMAARYRFQLRRPDERLALWIRESDAAGPLLIASLTGRARPLTDAALARALARLPLATFKVIAAIHWQALRLWWKGVPWYRAPGHRA